MSRKKTMKHHIDVVQNRVQSFVKIYAWIIRDFLEHAWKQTLIVFVFAAAFLFLRVFVVAAIIRVARKIGSLAGPWTGTVPIPVIGEVPFWVLAILVWLLLSGAALVGFLYQKAVFAVANVYMKEVFQRSVKLFSNMPNFYSTLEMTVQDRKSYLNFSFRHARMLMVFLRIILFSVFEMISAIACYVMLIWLNPMITLMFTVLIVIFLPFFYILSLRGLRNRQRSRFVFLDFSKRIQELEKELQTSAPLSKDRQSSSIKKMLRGKNTEDAFLLQQELRLVVFRSNFVSSVLAASILSLSIFLYLSHYHSIDGGAEQFTLFFATLFVMGRSLATSLKSIVSGNRLFESLIFLYRSVGPGRFKELPSQPEQDAAFVYKRRNGRMLPVLVDSDVYLYFPKNTRRFDWLPVSNCFTPCTPSSGPRDGELVVLNSKSLEDENRSISGGAYVFVPEGLLDGLESETRREIEEKHLTGKPRFVVLDEPLAAPPEGQSHWLYLWGGDDKVLGDCTVKEIKRFPSAAKVQKAVSKATAANKRASDDFDLEFDDM